SPTGADVRQPAADAAPGSVGTVASAALQIGRKQPAEGIPQPYQPAPVAQIRQRVRPALADGLPDVTNEFRHAGRIMDFDAQLEIQPQTARIDVGRADQRIIIIDHEQFGMHERDRKSTRLNSSHVSISYAVFCLKKKTTTY